MMKRIPLGLIYGNPDQPRKTFAEAELRELAASIRENGLKQPITVRAEEDGRYMIVMGERRFRAHQILAEQDSSVTDVLCHVTKVNDEQLAVDAIIENDQRVDVSPLEQARAYQRMIDEFAYDAQSLAKKLGKAQHRIDERLRLLDLTADCMFLFEKGQLTALQAWYLSNLPPTGQGLLLKAINSGQCPDYRALKLASEAIKESLAQIDIFGGATDASPPPAQAEINAARGFEARVEQIAKMLRDGIQDNVVTAVKRVNPTRAGTLADLMSAMQRDMKRLEDALRVAAFQQELTS